MSLIQFLYYLYTEISKIVAENWQHCLLLFCRPTYFIDNLVNSY